MGQRLSLVRVAIYTEAVQATGASVKEVHDELPERRIRRTEGGLIWPAIAGGRGTRRSIRRREGDARGVGALADVGGIGVPPLALHEGRLLGVGAAVLAERTQVDAVAEVMLWRTFARRWLPILAQSTICLRSTQRQALARELTLLLELAEHE